VINAARPQRALNVTASFADEYPFAPHDIRLSCGQRLHYVDEGTGSPILFVHGNPTWSFAWRRFIKALSPTHRSIAVDHIGCGRSDKPQRFEYRLAQHVDNLVELVERLHLRDVTLVAHDWGGAIGMGCAVRMPERFSRFVLMNTAAFCSTSIPFRIALCRLPLLGTLALRGLNAFSRAAISMAVEKRERMTPAVKAGFLAPYDSWANRIAVDRFVKDIPLRPSHPSFETLARIDSGIGQFSAHPMLLMWGMRDWCFSPEFLAEFERRFPHAQVCRFWDAGHYVFEDAHEVAIPKLQEFLASNVVLGCSD